jgi:ABC-type Zn uptake system ZnuABC Zn-binding protein ZnuA
VHVVSRLFLVTICFISGLSAEPLSVVVTNSILADLTRNIAGDAIELSVLAGPGTDPHTFEPAPSDIRRVVNAKVFIENGLSLESWTDKLIKSSGTKAVRVIASEGIEPLEAVCADHDHDHHHHDWDPHVWNDVELTKKMVVTIRDALIKADPSQTDLFTKNAAAYLDRLTALDAWVIEQTSSIPMENRKLVTNHDVFQYFAKRYQFKILGNVLGSITTEKQDPSAKQVAALIDQIKASGVPMIFGDFSSQAKRIEQIAQDAGVKVGEPLYIDTLGPPGSSGETYEKMMRHNVRVIVNGLRP